MPTTIAFKIDPDVHVTTTTCLYMDVHHVLLVFYVTIYIYIYIYIIYLRQDLELSFIK